MPPANAALSDRWPRTALVIGAGVIGQTVAVRLQRRGIATTLLDSEAAPRGASWGNAGHIAVEQVAPLASRAALRALPRRLVARGGPVALPWRHAATWLPFGLRLVGASAPARFAAGRAALAGLLAEALPAWRRLLDEVGAPALLREEGHFVVWESAATAAAGRAAWAAADTGTASFRDATAAELARLQALVAVPLAGAIRFEGSAQIADTGLLTEALRAAFVAAGGTLRTGQAIGLTMSRHSLSGASRGPEPAPCSVALGPGLRRESEQDMLEADVVVIAAGARSGALLRPLGHPVPLIAERGYHIQSDETDWPADLPPVVFEDRATIVTRFSSGLRAASFTEFAHVDAPPDPRRWTRLRTHVAGLGLPFRLPGEPWSGARPTLPDYLPAIGRGSAAPNLLYAFGHQHLGLTLAAVTADAVAALACGEAPAIDLTPFDLDRFGGRRRPRPFLRQHREAA